MNKTKLEHQRDKCKDYLNGNILVTDMFKLMAAHINELYGYFNRNGLDMNAHTDEQCCEILCKEIILKE